MRFKMIIVVVAMTAIYMTPCQSGATPVYIAATGEPALITNTGSTPQTAQFSNAPLSGFTYESKGSAGSVLGASSHILYSRTVSQGDFFGPAYIGPAYGQFVLDDIIISGTSGTVNTSLNLSINGTLAANTSIAGSGTSIYVLSNVRLLGNIGPPLAGTAFSGEMKADSSSTSSGTTNTFTATGIFSGFAAGFPGSGLVTTPLFNLPVGTPLTLALKLSAEPFFSGVPVQPPNVFFDPFVAYGESTIDFYHSLGFPTSGDVFNLPPGYTVNSLSGLIVNNRWGTPPTNYRIYLPLIMK